MFGDLGLTLNMLNTQPIPCLPMLWRLDEPVHQQAWYWRRKPEDSIIKSVWEVAPYWRQINTQIQGSYELTSSQILDRITLFRYKLQCVGLRQLFHQDRSATLHMLLHKNIYQCHNVAVFKRQVVVWHEIVIMAPCPY